MIDDDDVSCQIPTKTVAGSSIDMEIFTNVIKHAKISSQISRRLGSVKALHSSVTELIGAVAELNDQLQQWYGTLPAHLKLIVGKGSSPLASPTRLKYLMYLHNAYYGGLMAIHTIFTYPWISALFGKMKSQILRDQILASTNANAEAARKTILASRYIGVDGASPHW